VVDAMRFVSGLEAIEVLAELGTLFSDIDVEDSALVSVVFDGGVPASVDPAGRLPRRVRGTTTSTSACSAARAR
jgi:hypothetical protein